MKVIIWSNSIWMQLKTRIYMFINAMKWHNPRKLFNKAKPETKATITFTLHNISGKTAHINNTSVLWMQQFFSQTSFTTSNSLFTMTAQYQLHKLDFVVTSLTPDKSFLKTTSIYRSDIPHPMTQCKEWEFACYKLMTLGYLQVSSYKT